MKFTCSTKPLADGLNLGVVNANVSKFYRKSNLAQLQVVNNLLKINLEANAILTEIRLKGSGDAETSDIMFVDCVTLKQLVGTFDASTTTLEFAENGLTLHSGKSKFTIPKMVDAEDADMSLKAPALPEYNAPTVDVKKADWKFVKENQMYAIAMSFIHPVYTKVYCGSNGDVIVGDFDNSQFTLSQKSNLGTTCLLLDTIINLFNTLPEGAKLHKSDRDYLVHVQTDAFEYLAQFTPLYEGDEGVGEYRADIILSMLQHPATGYAEVPVAAVNKFLSQADLLSTSTDDTIRLGVENGQMFIKDKNVDCKVDIKCSESDNYFVDFKTALLKAMMSNFGSVEKVNIAPMKQDNEGETEYVGIIVWSDEMTTILAGTE